MIDSMGLTQTIRTYCFSKAFVVIRIWDLTVRLITVVLAPSVVTYLLFGTISIINGPNFKCLVKLATEVDQTKSFLIVTQYALNSSRS